MRSENCMQPCHVCNVTGLGSPLPRLQCDCACPCHIHSTRDCPRRRLRVSPVAFK